MWFHKFFRKYFDQTLRTIFHTFMYRKLKLWSLLCRHLCAPGRIAVYGVMAISIVEFLGEGYKIVIKWNHWILKIGVMGRCQKLSKFDFQSQFSMSKIIGSFWFFFHCRIWIKEHIFCVIDIFWLHQFLNHFIF